MENILDFSTKEEYINYCLKCNPDIVEIDTAIPKEVWCICKDNNIPTTYLVTVYYANTHNIENIIASALILHQNLRNNNGKRYKK